MSAFSEQYPLLYSMVLAVALDNNMEMREHPDISDFRYSYLMTLEGQVEKLSLEDRDTLATGEHSDAEEIVTNNYVHDLHLFLNECFQGKYYSEFFV